MSLESCFEVSSAAKLRFNEHNLTAVCVLPHHQSCHKYKVHFGTFCGHLNVPYVFDEMGIVLGSVRRQTLLDASSLLPCLPSFRVDAFSVNMLYLSVFTSRWCKHVISSIFCVKISPYLNVSTFDQTSIVLESARRRASLDASPQKSVGVHGHTSELCDKVLADRYDTSSSLSVKRVPTRTWPRSHVHYLLRLPMPHFPPEVNIFRFFYCYMYFFILYINMPVSYTHLTLPTICSV